jgi:hypothetical protein
LCCGLTLPEAIRLIVQDRTMNRLVEYFENNQDRVIHKWDHYFEIYDRHFGRFRGKSPVVVEIGVYQGGSLQMWKDYFGAGAKIIGIDINPSCAAFEEEDIRILIGDQGDRSFWKDVRARFPRIDILIDDGGHTFVQQRVTFEEMFGHVDKDGVFLVEDVHTSYWPKWGGGFRRPGTFVEYSKGLIDELNGWWTKGKDRQVTKLTKSCKSIQFYDSIIVFEKGEHDPPRDRYTGRNAERFKPLRNPQDPVGDLRDLPEPGSKIP